MKKVLTILGLLLVIFLLIFYFSPKNSHIYKTISIKAGEQTILAEVSDTDALRTLGLSGRKSLEEGRGMLFIFDKSRMVGFWMKDMNFPIDIVWVNALKQVVGVEDNISPQTYPKIYSSKEPVLYVLELPAGSYKKSPFTEINF